MRRQALALLVAALLATAGCSALAPGAGSDGGAATPTLTPAPVRETTASESPPGNATLPPGVAASGTVRPAALAAAHRSFLDGRSYTWTVSYVERLAGAEGQVYQEYDRRVAVESERVFRGLLDHHDGRADRRQYANGTGVFRKTTTDYSELSRYVGNGADAGQFLMLATGYLKRFLGVQNATLATVERDGQRFVRVHATDPPGDLLGRKATGDVRNYTLTAYVTPEGFVRGLTVSYDVHDDGRRIHYSLRFRYRAVGSTTVDRPRWVAARWGDPAGSGPGGPAGRPDA